LRQIKLDISLALSVVLTATVHETLMTSHSCPSVSRALSVAL